MGNKKLIKQLKRHPYLLDSSIIMSEEQAQRELADFEPVSFEKVVNAARLRSELPAEAWEPVERVQTRRNGGDSKKGRRSSRAAWTARIAVACAAVILICFFVLTPIGRAWAEETWDFIVRIFSGRIEIDRAGDPGSMSGAVLLPDSEGQKICLARSKDHRVR